jgi:hypothetical protein
MNIATATVKFFTDREGNKFGFTATGGEKKIYLGQRTYRRPEILANGSVSLRMFANLARLPGVGEEVWLDYRRDGENVFAIAWCTKVDVLSAQAEVVNRRFAQAEVVFGVDAVMKFPKLVDACAALEGRLLPGSFKPNRGNVYVTREMPPNMILEPAKTPARGTSEYWFAVMREASSHRVVRLPEGGRLIERLSLAGILVDRETNLPIHAREFVIIRLVERRGSLSCFAYARSAVAFAVAA